ncbi:hypothetical protein MRX96_022071, partial [Rhipicephalus microplus]
MSALLCTHGAREVFLALKNIRANEKEHEVPVYAATEGNYGKGVIRNVDCDIGDAKLARLIVHQGNTTVHGVIRTTNTGFVVVLFDEGDVSSYIKVGQAIVRCYPYKKQNERGKDKEMERAFDLNLRDFPTLQAGPPGPSSSGWLQPFFIGCGSALPVDPHFHNMGLQRKKKKIPSRHKAQQASVALSVPNNTAWSGFFFCGALFGIL